MENEFFRPITEGERIISYDYIAAAQSLSPGIDIYKGLDKSVKTIQVSGQDFMSIDLLKSFLKEGYEYVFTNCNFGIFSIEDVNNAKFKFTFSESTRGLKLSFTNCNNVIISSLISAPEIDFDVKNCDGFELHVQPYSILKVRFENSLSCVFGVTGKGKADVDVDVEFLNTQFSSIYFVDITLRKFVFEESVFTNLAFRDIVSDVSMEIRMDYFSNNEITLVGCDFKSGIKLFCSSEEQISGSPWGPIWIINSTNIELNTLNISSLLLMGYNLHNIKVINSKMHSLQFREFSVANDVSINSTIFGNYDVLSLVKSSLDGLEMNPSILHYYKQIEFADSSLMGIKIYSFKEILQPIFENSEKMRVDQKIDFARELTALMIGQNNKYLTTVYKALEQEFRLQSMKPSFNMDYVILVLNSLSNGHGTKPHYALLCMVCFIFFHFEAMTLEFYFSGACLSAFEFLFSNISYYFKPFTFITDINYNDYSFSKYFIFIDFVYKIFFAYLIYQFVAAFRKFNK